MYSNCEIDMINFSFDHKNSYFLFLKCVPLRKDILIFFSIFHDDNLISLKHEIQLFEDLNNILYVGKFHLRGKHLRDNVHLMLLL